MAVWRAQGEKEKKKEKQNSSATPCFHNFQVKGVFNQLAPTSEVLSNCSYSSSELLRPGSDPQLYHLHIVMGKGASDAHVRVRTLYY